VVTSHTLTQGGNNWVGLHLACLSRPNEDTSVKSKELIDDLESLNINTIDS
jgi:hypothetical protein